MFAFPKCILNHLKLYNSSNHSNTFLILNYINNYLITLNFLAALDNYPIFYGTSTKGFEELFRNLKQYLIFKKINQGCLIIYSPYNLYFGSTHNKFLIKSLAELEISSQYGLGNSYFPFEIS